MITDEIIQEIAHRKCRKYRHMEDCRYHFDEATLSDFARALLGEVSLQDMLREEEEFIRENESKFRSCFEIDGLFALNFCSFRIEAIIRMELIKCVDWKDYCNWKKTIQAKVDNKHAKGCQ